MRITYSTKLRHIEKEAWRLKDSISHAPFRSWETYDAYREGIVEILLEEVEVPLTEEIKNLIHSIVFNGVDCSIDNWTMADYFNNQE